MITLRETSDCYQQAATSHHRNWA